jgi:hypothetical protein
MIDKRKILNLKSEKKTLSRNKNSSYFFVTTLILFVLLLTTFSLVSISAYFSSAPAHTFGYQTGDFTGGQLFSAFDRAMCGAGQDFLLQIDPLGCTPSVVRSDLLEEQDVVVFCPVYATQLNPLIKIEQISHMTISSRNLPQEVMTVGYYPARAALGRFGNDIATPVFDNIGYATIVLRQQRNESALTNCMDSKFLGLDVGEVCVVEGNLTANIRYDITNAFGTGRVIYYLPQLTDEDWDRDYSAYGFWDGRGYLRLEGSDNNGATIGVYSDRDISGTGRSGEKTRISSLNLEEGQSREVFIPGFNYCLGGVNVKLNDLENPATRARLRVDSELIEMKAGDKFMENKCVVRSMEKRGVNQFAEISCKEDGGKDKKFNLRISPKITLSVNGIEKEYGVGDFLYEEKTERETNSVYLGFIGNNRTAGSPEDLYIRVISIPRSEGGNKETLGETDISYVARYDKSVSGSDLRQNPAGEVSEILAKTLSQVNRFFKFAITGKKLAYTHYSASADTSLFGTKIDILGYSGAYNVDLEQAPREALGNYTKAIEDYETIKDSFASDRWPENDLLTIGEKALYNSITLANGLDQRKTAGDLCQEFFENYDSVAPSICNDESLRSNTEISSQSVLINGRTHIISLEGIREPRFEEFGLVISVRSSEGTEEYRLSNNEVVYINDTSGEYIELIGLEPDSATLKVIVDRISGVGTSGITNQKLGVGKEETFGSRYSFRIREINLQKVAKVSLEPNIDYARTNATFSFKVGIEKRGIQLSPEKTSEKIQSLNETLERWTKISDNLGKVVSAGKTACAVTAGALTIKNFFSNLGGKAIARQKAMRDDNGWYDKCQREVNQGASSSVESCLLEHSDEIEATVDDYESAMNIQNSEINNLQQGISETKFLGETIVDTDKLTIRLMNDVGFKSDISSCVSNRQITVGGQTINAEDIALKINENTTSLTQARDLQLNCRLLGSGGVTAEIANAEVNKLLGEIHSNAGAIAAKIPTSSENNLGISEWDVHVSGNQITSYYKGEVSSQQIGDLSVGVPIRGITYNNKKYIVQLENVGGNSYRIVDVFYTSGIKVSKEESDEINSRFKFESVNPNAYKNAYTNAEVRYYETDPYKGLPAVVPFDIQNGWYAAVKSTLPILGGLRAYDDSGRVSSFYVCNVGINGREEFLGGDDDCRGFVPKTGASPLFSGMDERESLALKARAEKAIEDATIQYSSGVSKITINNQGINVGNPAADIPDIQCEDFMSPTDCNIMFNVCDPFVCPSSRCDLGGRYPVKDVVQSGIVGSLALCLPNFPEVKVPICVSGVHAGVEGWLSVVESYQQCLQESLDTGATIGICDEINSVYMCEFVWRQGLPVIKYAVPQIITSVLGQNVRGGGEYLGTQSAIDNVGKSFDYFTQYYADDSFRAFKARSAEGVGTEICKNWVSIAGPEGGNLFDALTAPDSPTQFYGRFEEIPYTTATNPPASQYKVFYHIYSGKDFPAYYQVYLRGTGSSFFQDSGFRRPVASGFIPKGDFKTETIDFTAPSGYQELCIVVNGQEQCGFKQVTTEFGINYLTEQYVADEASRTDINSEKGCVSGSAGSYNYLDPINLAQTSSGIFPQSGVDEALNPAIYNRGIIRVCSTNNPGQATNPTRWKDVGYCDNQNLRCWLDESSVKNVIKDAYTEEQILGEVEGKYLEALEKEGLYIADFNSFTKELDELEGKDLEIIKAINANISKVFLSNQIAYLHLFRGFSYGNLAFTNYILSLDKLKQDTPAGTPGAGDDFISPDPELVEEIANIGKNYPVFYFEDGIAGSEDLHYSFSGDEWYWSDKKNSGFVPVNNAPYLGSEGLDTSGQDVTTVELLGDKYNRLADEPKRVIESLKEKTYLQGVILLVQATERNDGGTWYDLKVASKLSTDNVEFKPDKRFKLNIRGIIYWFEYNNVRSNWKWSFNEKTWMNVPETVIRGSGLVNFDGSEPIQEMIEIIKSLENKGYYDGAEIIFGVGIDSYAGGTGGTGGTSGTTNLDTTIPLVKAAAEELTKWENGNVGECDTEADALLREYWGEYGTTNFNCANDAWSAVFTSYVAKQSGVNFPNTGNHALNFKAIRENSQSYGVEIQGRNFNNLQVGDILFSCRQSNGQGTCPVSPALVGEGDFGHSMIIVDRNETHVWTIGGNEADSVRLKTRSINDELFLGPETFDPISNNKYYYGFISYNS